MEAPAIGVGSAFAWTEIHTTRLRVDCATPACAEGVTVTPILRVGFAGPGRILNRVLRLYFSDEFATALDAHVRTEF